MTIITCRPLDQLTRTELAAEDAKFAALQARTPVASARAAVEDVRRMIAAAARAGHASDGLAPCTGKDCGVLIDADEPVALCLSCQEQRHDFAEAESR